MAMKKDLQSEAQKKVQALLKSAEEMRRLKRVAHGVAELTRGRLELLHNDELAGALPEYLAEESTEGIDSAQLLLRRIGEASVGRDRELRTRAVMILSLSIDRIVGIGNFDMLTTLASILNAWLTEETEFVAGYDVICRQIREVCNRLIQRKSLQEAQELVFTLFAIQGGQIERKKSMRSVAARTLSQIAAHDTLDMLFDEFLKGQGQRKGQAEALLKCLGQAAISRALELAGEVEEEGKRRQLITFLTCLGRPVLRVFEERLQDDIPWGMRRDILLVLASMHDDGAYPLVEMNIAHPDVRVQREAVDCIFKLGGESMVERLIQALFKVEDTLKNLIVKKLAKLNNLAIRDALLTLLDGKVLKKDFRDEMLLSSIIVALQPYPDTRALIQLREFRELVENRSGSRQLLHLIDDTLLTMESEMRHRRHQKIETESVGFAHDPEALRQAKRKTQEIEKEVIKLLEEGKGREAAEMLFESCVEAAKEKDFFTAERLRDRILGADTAAVQLVIEADEVIHWERNSKIPASYYQTWKPLRSAIGAREFEALYSVFTSEQYLEDEIIAREGERDGRLYFINSGTVSLVCASGGANTFLKRLKPGSVVGAEQFFSISVWTVTVRARSAVELHSLKVKDLQELERDYPGMTRKLQDYCTKSNAIPELLKMSGGDRRTAPRFKVAAMINTVLVDAYGTTGNRSFVCQLMDISQGGFSYSIGIANPENARQMLGRQVRFDLSLAEDSVLSIEGKVVGIESIEGRKELYRVHARLLESLASDEVNRIVKMIG